MEKTERLRLRWADVQEMVTLFEQWYNSIAPNYQKIWNMMFTMNMNPMIY